MACSVCLLGNDSGPANVAAALGRPSYALCGGVLPPHHSPDFHFIEPDLPSDHGKGMERISAQHALNTMIAVLGKQA